MARHSSSRDRIEHLRAEAEVTRKEKVARAAAKKTAPAKKSARPSSASSGRIRVVWLLCDQAGRTVDTYPYAKEAEARAAAAKLTEETGKTHFVNRGEVPFE